MFPWNLFPFNENIKNMMNQMKPGEMEKYTEDMIGKIMESNMKGMINPQDVLKGVFSGSNENAPQYHPTLQYTVFETHEHVFVRLAIKSEEWLKSMKICHTSNLVIVEHVPNEKDRHTITLPAIVKKKGTSANFKDGILEIKMPKSVDMQYSEIDVTEVF